jgi:hypothetical protein
MSLAGGRFRFMDSFKISGMVNCFRVDAEGFGLCVPNTPGWCISKCLPVSARAAQTFLVAGDC